MLEAFGLEGKIALITGGSRGIGLGMAEALAGAGANVVLVGRNEAALDSALKKVRAKGVKAWRYSFDLANLAAIAGFYDGVLAGAGPIDILINNAGVNKRGPTVDMDLDDWAFVHRVNLDAMFVLCKVFARERIDTSRPGKIINVASLASEVARPGIAAYTSAKGAVKQLTKALAVEWAPNHINVNAIGPGYIATDMTKPLREDERFSCWIKRRTPLGRWGKPEDLGGLTVFLASSASDFITGQTIYVDGGFLATM